MIESWVCEWHKCCKLLQALMNSVPFAYLAKMICWKCNNNTWVHEGSLFGDMFLAQSQTQHSQITQQVNQWFDSKLKPPSDEHLNREDWSHIPMKNKY